MGLLRERTRAGLPSAWSPTTTDYARQPRAASTCSTAGWWTRPHGGQQPAGGQPPRRLGGDVRPPTISVRRCDGLRRDRDLPGGAAVLGLGIGATVAVFSLVDPGAVAGAAGEGARADGAAAVAGRVPGMAVGQRGRRDRKARRSPAATWCRTRCFASCPGTTRIRARCSLECSAGPPHGEPGAGRDARTAEPSWCRGSISLVLGVGRRMGGCWSPPTMSGRGGTRSWAVVRLLEEPVGEPG